MANTSAQGLRQQIVRDFVGAPAIQGTYNEDWLNYITVSSGADFVGGFNGRLLVQLNFKMNTSYDNLPGAMAAFARYQALQNLVSRSQEFNAGAWTKTDTTITADALAAPDGTVTADLATEGSAGTAQVSNSAALVTLTTYTASMFLKRGNTDWVRLRVNSASDQFRGWFNLATGAKGQANAVGAASVAGSTIADTGNGWYRCTLTGQLTDVSAPVIQIGTAASDGSTTPVSGGTYNVWGAQINAGAAALDYAATIAAYTGPAFGAPPTNFSSMNLFTA